MQNDKRTPISCAYEHTIATDIQGNVWGWGRNDCNQLGLSNSVFFKSPQRISGIPPIHSVGCGLSHAVAIDLNKNLWTWGWNYYGQLGHNHQQRTIEPKKLTGLPPVLQIACGANHTIILDDTGTVWSWGLNSYLQLGSKITELYRTEPVAITTLPKIVYIASGGNYSAAIDENRNLWVWGTLLRSWNLIDIDSCLPHRIDTNGPVNFIACGTAHAVAINMNNDLLSWGQNSEGQLGLRESAWRIDFQENPAKILSLPSVESVSCGEAVTAVIDSNGKPWMWGKIFLNRRNTSPSSVTFNSFTSRVPIQLHAPSRVRLEYISCGAFHIFATDENEQVWCWGDNDFGQLGLGHTAAHDTLQQLKSLNLSPVKLHFFSKKSSRTLPAQSL